MDADGTTQVIRAQVPETRAVHVRHELRSLTGGRGTFSQVLDHYEEVPLARGRDKVIEAHRGAAAAAH